MNLSALDVIRGAHASGAICIMAHPRVNLNRTNNKKDAVNTLLEYGIDGFEMLNNSMDSETFQLITSLCGKFNSQNKLIFTGGSDFHIFSENSRIGKFNNMPITCQSQSTMIHELKDINRARKKKYLTHREYEFVGEETLDDMVDGYSKKAHQINEIYSEAQKLMGTTIEDDLFSESSMSYMDYLKEHGIYNEGSDRNR